MERVLLILEAPNPLQPGLGQFQGWGKLCQGLATFTGKDFFPKFPFNPSLLLLGKAPKPLFPNPNPGSDLGRDFSRCSPPRGNVFFLGNNIWKWHLEAAGRDTGGGTGGQGWGHHCYPQGRLLGLGGWEQPRNSQEKPQIPGKAWNPSLPTTGAASGWHKPRR